MLTQATPVKQLAAVDIGSKAVRMVLGDLSSGGQLQIQQRWRAFLSLGESVFKAQSIPTTKILALQQVLQSFQNALPKDIPWFISATSAFREAKNRVEVRQELAKQGYLIRVLTGLEEAELIHYLFRRQWPELSGTTLHADLGGGSLELSLEQGAELQWQDSLPLGILRTGKKLDLSCLQELRQPFANVQLHCRQLVVSGGSAREWGEQLVSEGIFGCHEPGRSVFEYQFLPLKKAKTRSAAIFSGLIELWKPEQVVLSRIGLKEGLLLELAEQISDEQCRLKLGGEVPVHQVKLTDSSFAG
jgi:exopolyphosphatase/pppGpp-phosphohydrolase